MDNFIQTVESARKALAEVAVKTPLEVLKNFSSELDARVYLKREDLQPVRSYKLRGAYYKISLLDSDSRDRGVICASAGNHAQGVALACSKLGIRCSIYMPVTTPSQKIRQVEWFGQGYATIVLTGDTFDQANTEAQEESIRSGRTFIPPFDDPEIIAGQGTIALEILEQTPEPIEYLFIPIGGGGLAAGMIQVFRKFSPNTRIIGVEPEGAPSMAEALKAGKPVKLDKIDTFTDGAAVRCVGELTFSYCKDQFDEMLAVPEGLISQVLLRLYAENAIVAEPAGALSLAGAMMMRERLWGRTVAAILSGGNNDLTRFPEIREKALLYAKLKHYFIVRFPQRPGALKLFVDQVLGPDDDIVHFEYTKKTARENGPALIGIELKRAEDYEALVLRMKAKGFLYEYVNDQMNLMQFLI